MPTVLLSSGFCDATREALSAHWQIIDIPSHRDALEYLQGAAALPDAVVIGYAAPLEPPMGDLPAHTMLTELLAIDRDLPVIISTRVPHAETIVSLIKRGAFDYVTEPPNDRDPEAQRGHAQRLGMAIERALRWRKIVLENRRLRLGNGYDAVTILGNSEPIRRINDLIHKVAATPATVLVTGESGSGKELVARAIHASSDRSAAPFVGINCGSLEDTLLRSELFGHEKGAFTGADIRRLGLLREASRGTLFLDELGTISPAFQMALLRVLEDRTARPVGGNEVYQVGCRFVAASNQDLAALVEAGDFREDLYYRLNVFQIRLPPLRDRRQDIPVLAHHFLSRMAGDYGKPDAVITPLAMEALEAHHWPGNVRELRNAIERALILCTGEAIRPEDLILSSTGRQLTDQSADLQTELALFEQRLIRKALQQTAGNISAAAKLLGIKRPTLHYRIRQLGLETNRVVEG